MKTGSYLPLGKIVLSGRSAGNILMATIFSFTFSITVILCTFGLMDGFDHLLKSGLRHSSGDILISSRKGFFPLDQDLQERVNTLSPTAVAPVIQTEAFALFHGKSKGVLVRGVEERNFSKATGLNLTLEDEGVVIGEELAKTLGLKIGDEMALTLSRGNESSQGLPSVKIYRVSGFIKHGIYQKDLRFVYLKREEVSDLLGVGDKVNLLILATQDMSRSLENLDSIGDYSFKLRQILDESFLVRPFWSEYSFLIEAVRVEKFSISLILQLIVVVAVFNIIAFVIYIMEKKAQEFFFLRAVGLSLKNIMNFWFLSVILLWAISCVGAYFLSQVFNLALKHLPLFQIPGEIYVLSSLSIRLDAFAYFTVYSLSLVWILMAASFGYWRLKRRPILQGLRQEFS